MFSDFSRTNSAQSVRIRSLESEVSSILAENLELRERVIKLQSDLDLDLRPETHLLDSLDPLQTEVQSKLVELGDLVKYLGKVHIELQCRRKRGTKGAQILQTDGPIVPRASNTKMSGSQPRSHEGRLPSIIEGKCFTRQFTRYERKSGVVQNAKAKRFSVDEFAQIPNCLSDEVASPVLGSPPNVSFAISGESGADDALSKGNDREVGIIESPRLTAFTNLEVRKKRRERSTPVNAEIERLEYQAGKAGIGLGQSLTEPMLSLKVGAKRKLTAREDCSDKICCNGPAPRFHHQKGPGFTASREVGKVMDENVRSDAFQQPQTSIGDRAVSSREPKLVSRKALEPKCVNIDPVTSPTKTKVRDNDKKDPVNTSRTIKARERSTGPLQAGTFGDDSKQRGRKTFAAVAPPEPPEPPLRPPETPIFAAPDSFSPMSSEASSANVVPRDTPPPSDLSISGINEDGKGSVGRSSRRAKGAVSYVQPNLRDKMRRPTKELVDAVTGEGRSHYHRGDAARPVLEPGENDAGIGTVVISREDASYDGSRGMVRDPSSPLRNKGSSDSTSTGEPKRRRDSVSQSGTEGESSRRASSSAADKLEDGSKKKECVETSIADAKQDIFDFQTSSPATDTSDAGSSLEAKQSRRVSRRHSSVQMLRTKDAKTAIDKSSITRQSVGKKLENLDGLREALDYSFKDENRKNGSRVGACTNNGPDRARAERTANRRRSMML